MHALTVYKQKNKTEHDLMHFTAKQYIKKSKRAAQSVVNVARVNLFG